MIPYQRYIMNSITLTWAQLMATDYVYVRNSHITDSSEQTLIYNYLVSKFATGGYYETTFGVNGQNKTVCDFVYFFRTSSSTSNRSNTKLGNLLRWDIDGGIYEQNAVPVYTKGSNNGYVLLSSSDGWDGMTFFNVAICSFIGTCPNLSLPNCTQIQLNINSFSGKLICSLSKNVIAILINSNDFEQIFVYPNTKTNAYNLASNNLNTTNIDNLLSEIRLYFSSNDPSTNITMTLNGTGMSSPTGGSLNADIVAIKAKYISLGRVATILIN